MPFPRNVVESGADLLLVFLWLVRRGKERVGTGGWIVVNFINLVDYFRSKE